MGIRFIGESKRARLSVIGLLNFFIATPSVCCKNLIACHRAGIPFGPVWLMKVNVSTNEGAPSPKETTGWRESLNGTGLGLDF